MIAWLKIKRSKSDYPPMHSPHTHSRHIAHHHQLTRSSAQSFKISCDRYEIILLFAGFRIEAIKYRVYCARHTHSTAALAVDLHKKSTLMCEKYRNTIWSYSVPEWNEKIKSRENLEILLGAQGFLWKFTPLMKSMSQPNEKCWKIYSTKIELNANHSYCAKQSSVQANICLKRIK